MSNDKSGNPGNFANDREKASEAGQKGGHNSGGNFANDPQRASEAGQKGGQNSGGNGSLSTYLRLISFQRRNLCLTNCLATKTGALT